MRLLAPLLTSLYKEYGQCRQPGFLSTGCEPTLFALVKETNTRGVTSVESDTTQSSLLVLWQFRAASFHRVPLQDSPPALIEIVVSST